MLALSHSLRFVAIVFIASGIAKAQTPVPGSCTRPLARAVLDVNDVRAEIDHGGIISYEVPAGSESYAIQTSDIWIGGYVAGDLRVAGERWNGWDFWPGPLDQGAFLPDPNDCSPYDKLFEVSSDHFEEYGLHGTVAREIEEWPWDLGAPVVDGDSIAGNYNIYAGDKPELIGHKRFWWVMNDVGNVHGESQSDPLGIEIHGSAAAAVHPHDAVNNTTIHSYRIINRNIVPIDSMFLGIYAEADLNWRNEIFIGVDTTIGMSFAYNPIDEDHDYYGGSPPAIGLVLLKGWPSASDGLDNDYDGQIDESGEEAGLSHFISWGGSEDIIRAQAKYNMMTGFFRTGVPLTYGRLGRRGTKKTRYLWPGDPVTGAYWSAVNIDSTGIVPKSHDRPGSVTSFGPFRLDPGEYAEFTFAYVWAQGEDNFDSITKLRAAAETIKIGYLSGLYSRFGSFVQPLLPPRPTDTAALAHNFPDPFSESSSIQYRVSDQARVKLVVYDVLGRSVETLVDKIQDEGVYSAVFDGRIYPPGVYFYRIEIGHASATRSMMLVK